MKLYTVKVPIVAVCYVEVKAENEEEAMEKAFRSEDLNIENVEEWGAYRIIVEGNCLHTSDNEAEIVSEEEIEESEETEDEQSKD